MKKILVVDLDFYSGDIAASLNIFAASAEHFCADGWKLNIIGFLPFIDINALNIVAARPYTSVHSPSVVFAWPYCSIAA